MTDVVQPTARPFTVVVCTGCPTGRGHPKADAVLKALSGAVRSCPHGMLVSVRCLLGASCSAQRPGDGVIAALQPCTNDRIPTDRAHVVGPIHDDFDTARLRAWVQCGRWHDNPLSFRACPPNSPN